MKNPIPIIYHIIIFLLFTIIGIAQSEYDLQNIIDKTIEKYGGTAYKNALIEFDFRDRHYKVFRKNGNFLYERFYSDSSGNIHEGFDNKSVFKKINNQTIDLTTKKSSSLKESINSVIYFFTLPYSLNDRAVIKKYLGVSNIKNKQYYLIEVTFKQESGGRDFEDRYVYWIKKDNYSMDFFAYYFHVNGGGSRFRRVHNVRRVEGIVFGDQENFTSDEINTNIEDYKELFENGDLKKLSDINIENVKVIILK